MTTSQAVAFAFADEHLYAQLDQASEQDIDALNFGLIGIDAEGVVQRYNRFESNAAGLSMERVIGHAFFTVVAPCMNNFMVAQRFEDARESGTSLDTALDYVLTLRMRPVKVRLRLLAAPGRAMRYVLVHRAI